MSAIKRLLRIFSVIRLASDVMGESEARIWLFRKVPSLDNEMPINLLDTEVGHQLVLQTLRQIKYGIYS